MYKRRIYPFIGVLGICLATASCRIPVVATRDENRSVPGTFGGSRDTANSAAVQWRNFFTDKDLASLIDTALKNNQELMITLQEIGIARNDIRIRKGRILPAIGLKAGAGMEKVGRYTSQGAGDASTEIEPGKEMPDPLGDFGIAAQANWEADIWKKLRTAKKAAVARYLATVEGKNFVLTNLVAEVANSYYELLALDNQLNIVKQNIGLQKNALGIIKTQKEAARATELAVQKFQAEVLKSQSLEFEIMQQIRETENRINLLLGRYPEEITRHGESFLDLTPQAVSTGIPSQLLLNRPDIQKAELELTAAKLDVKVARAEFYPSLGISAGIGLQAFKPSYLVKFPESLLYSLAGDLAGPLINRNAIKAEFFNANARQLQAMYNYERTILNAYLEVSTQLSNISNLGKSYELKSQQVAALTRSIDISNDLFKSARADYLEVLMTQRDALESKLELIETKKSQLNAVVNIYKDLGGGWK
ncbi:TolC family protein [Chitinophaga sp. GCM10012297]|uniref:Efflux transporter outer membrane subunit n=1 Tax=Chitinophaga chungangae TaxID=2821488 RepID=A0ABS3YF96_9BACT|nr:efflux transporter outer membrane subunit [Chitinophaga chungangae]MBO9153356.1 efflux transporter outer membrane subunit [Chitinophaga chungangae]